MWFDLLFVFIFLWLEWVYYRNFRSFEMDMLNQLAAVNDRLEILIERIDEDRHEKAVAMKYKGDNDFWD